MSSYLIREGWDHQKRPARIYVDIDPTFWQMGQTDQRRACAELAVSVRSWLAEMKTEAVVKRNKRRPS